MTSAGSSSSVPCPPPVTADPLVTPTDSYGGVFLVAAKVGIKLFFFEARASMENT